MDAIENKKAESTLESDRFEFLRHFENLPLLVYNIGLDGRIINCNRMVVETLGYKNKKELIGKPFLTTIYAPSSRKKAKKIFLEWKKTDKIKNEALQIITKKGKVIDVLLNTNTIYDKKKNPVCSISTQLDITELEKAKEKVRKYTEELEESVNKKTKELQDSEKGYRQLVELSPEAIFIHSNGKFVFANSATAKLYGVANIKDLLGKRVIDFVHPDYQKTIKLRIEKALKEGVSLPFIEIKLIRLDGTVIDVESTGIPFTYRGMPAILVINRDISDRKRLESSLRRLERMAIIGETAAMVGHDLRNPLQAIFNMLYIANKKRRSMPLFVKDLMNEKGLNQLLEDITKQVSYMDKIVSDLQDYATPIKPKFTETNLRQLVDDSLNSIKIPKNIRISVRFQNDFPKLSIDQALMRRVFINLITNALQAMPKGGILTISVSKTRERALINFKDTGVGISERDVEKLFSPLYTTKAKGQGFGLAVCKRLIEAHYGDIDVKSKLGEGSTFTINLPL